MKVSVMLAGFVPILFVMSTGAGVMKHIAIIQSGVAERETAFKLPRTYPNSVPSSEASSAFLALNLLQYKDGGLDMTYRLKRILEGTTAALEILHRVPRRSDYKRLSQYILKITQLQDIGHILYELSRCLKDILDYELFGFALREGESINVWIDPRVHGTPLMEVIGEDFDCQNIDNIRHFEMGEAGDGHNVDGKVLEGLLSYTVSDNFSARLYTLPRRKMLHYHDEIMKIIVKTLETALENAMNIKKLETQAVIDPLTGCYNRRALNSYLEHDIANVHRYSGDLSVIMFDIDHFKGVNDSHGHQAGDRILREISKMVQSKIRKSDYLARYGGEEFVLVLRNTQYSYALELAERLRIMLEEGRISLGRETIGITASFGVASLRVGSDRERLLAEADAMVYRAKASGRNKVMPEPRSYTTYSPAAPRGTLCVTNRAAR
jgi:diguanylate cyclase (GGDEF)-like protein